MALYGLFCSPHTCRAQVQFNSLQEVLNFADAHAIAIQGAAMTEDLLGLKKKETLTNLLPTTNIGAAYNDNITLQPALVPAQLFNPMAPEGTLEEVTFGTRYNYSLNFNAQWDILNFQKLFAIKTAEAEWQQGQLNTAVSKMNTYNSLANTYYSIVLTQQAMAIYKENVTAATAINTHATHKHTQGLISQANLNLANIKLMQSQNTLQTAQNSLDQLYVQLQSQLNINDAIQVTDSMAGIAQQDWYIDTTHPEVLLKEAELVKQESILKQTKAIRYPSISLTYQSNRTWATNDFFNFSNANELPQQVFGASISIPFLGNASSRQKIKQSRMELGIKQLELDNTRLVKQKEDELLVLQLTQAKRQVKQNESILQLQTENDGHAKNKYEQDLMGIEERLDVYDDLLATQESYLQSMGTLTIAQYQLYIRNLNYN